MVGPALMILQSGLSVPFPLRFLIASQPAVMGKVLGIVYRTIATHLTHKVGYSKASAQAGHPNYPVCPYTVFPDRWVTP